MKGMCIFCEIAGGAMPAMKIYESDAVIAFLDITPVNPGHVLLAPKKHSRNILDIKPEDMREIADALPPISKAVKEGVNADGVNIHINNEAAAGQKVFHTHIHIIPRFENDGLTMWRGEAYEKEEEKASVAQNIRAVLSRKK